MKSLVVFTIGLLFATLFIGIIEITATSESDNVAETVDTVNDAIDVIDTTIERTKLINKQLKDPTNATLLTENLIEITNTIADPENIEKFFMRYFQYLFQL